MTSPLSWKQKLKTWRSILAIVSCVFIGGGVVAWSFLRNITGIWYLELAKLLAGTIIVVGIGGLVSEWPKITRFLLKGLEAIIKREIKTLGEKVLDEYKVGFSQRASDVQFLGNFTPDTLKDFRKATTEALFKHPVDPVFVSAIETDLYPSLDRPCRYNYKIILTHTLANSPRGIQYIDVSTTTTWTYMNFSSKKTTIEQPFTAHLKRIDGINDEELFRNTVFKVNGVDTDLVFSSPMWNPKTKEFDFKAQYNISIEDTPIDVLMEYKKKIPIYDHYRFLVHYPIQNLEFTYNHPSDFSPSLFVFGIKGKLECITSQSTIHVWRYKGCLFRRHGCVLLWGYSPPRARKENKMYHEEEEN